jgi:hypothetical protein
VPFDAAPAQGLSLLGEYAGSSLDPWSRTAEPVNVRVSDGLAFVAIKGDGLRIIDVSDPAAMKQVGHRHRPGGYNDVKLAERASDGARFALCSGDPVGVDVVDVSDPGNPRVVTNFSQSGSVHTLFLEGDRAYLADDGLSVWDIADPAAPILLGEYYLPVDPVKGGASVHDLMVRDGIAYLNYWTRGLVWVDTRDPTAIAQLGLFDDYELPGSHSNWVTEVNGCLVSVHGDEGYAAHLRVIGVDPRCPEQEGRQLGELSLRPEVSIHNIMALGTTAYVAHYQDGVRVMSRIRPRRGW